MALIWELKLFALTLPGKDTDSGVAFLATLGAAMAVQSATSARALKGFRVITLT